MAPQMDMSPGTLAADRRLYAMSEDLCGMSSSAGFTISRAESSAGDCTDVATGCQVFGTGFQEAVNLFGRAASLLGYKIGKAKITYENTDQRAAALVHDPEPRRIGGPV